MRSQFLFRFANLATLCYTFLTYFKGGCYDIAKRNLSKTKVSLPHVHLSVMDGSTVKKVKSQLLSFHPHDPLPKNYKLHYGIRFCAVSEEKLMFYGFDLFHQISSMGLDLESFLVFCHSHGFLVDWYNFQRTADLKGWSLSALIKKVKYPLLDVYGKKYCDEVIYRFRHTQWSTLADGDPVKESFRHLFS